VCRKKRGGACFGKDAGATKRKKEKLEEQEEKLVFTKKDVGKKKFRLFKKRLFRHFSTLHTYVCVNEPCMKRITTEERHTMPFKIHDTTGDHTCCDSE